MAKLFPPQISGTIPAFYGSFLTVPFVMNQTVSWTEIVGFRLKLKSIANNDIVLQKSISVSNEEQCDKEKKILYFPIEAEKLKKGTSYKLQLAYIGEKNKDGYFSTVGIVKYTSKPDVYIEGLENVSLANATNEYTGVYSQEDKDSTEKVYSYRFDIRDNNGNIIETSGDLIHNHENDDFSYETHDSYTVTTAFEENQYYTIQYCITTMNGLEEKSSCYRVIKQSTIEAEINAELTAEMNVENGYVSIELIGKKDNQGKEYLGKGHFLISRASSEDSYRTWSEVCRFALYDEITSRYEWKDFTVQHGYDYIYSLQQYNDYQIYSNRLFSNAITASFEHCFLFDGERQLKIKYNPKIGSFKTVLQEQKIETLGGKYPSFFRNGNVEYKEFPISGLISYHSDEEELFLTNENLFLDNYDYLTRTRTLKDGITTKDNAYFKNISDRNFSYFVFNAHKAKEAKNSTENLIAQQKSRSVTLEDYNITAERIFKMTVLDWLNNGKPKLFRSPSEGNFLVRLSSVSLTPQDQLSRMIHNFSAQATEIDIYDYKKLSQYNMLQIEDPVIPQLRWKTVDFIEQINATGGISYTSYLETIENEYQKKRKNIEENVYLTDLEKETSLESLDEYYELLIEEIKAGEISIGSENNIYTIQCLDMAPGDKIHIYYKNGLEIDKKDIQVGITGAYYLKFDEPPIKVTFNRTSHQGQITYSYYSSNIQNFNSYKAINMSDFPVKQFIGSTNGKDVKELIEDVKYRVTKYNFLNFFKRPVEIAYGLNEMINPLVVYKIGESYYDGATRKILKNYQCKFWVDDKEVDLTETGHLYLSEFDKLPKIILGEGVALDASIQRREIIYDIEESDKNLIELKQKNLEDCSKIHDIITKDFFESIKEYAIAIEVAKKNEKESYKKFIETLEEVLKERRVLENG